MKQMGPAPESVPNKRHTLQEVTEVFGEILYRLCEWPSCRAVSKVLLAQDNSKPVHGLFRDCIPPITIIVGCPDNTGVRIIRDIGGSAQARGFLCPVMDTKECHRLKLALHASNCHWMELELELDFSGGVISVRKVKVDTDSIPGSSTIPESVSDPDEAWPGIL